LRRIREADLDPPRVLGVDDWAWRKGSHYGTILCDLERGRRVDLLPDRTAETLAAWLRNHPSVEIVVRDRAGAYAEGARQGAPQAVQVADRWHLLRNGSDALRGVLDHHHRHLDEAAQIAAASLTDEPAANNNTLDAARAQDTGLPVTKAEQRSLDAQRRRDARFEEAVRLREQGMTIRGIARALGVGRKTVRRWLRAGHAPTWRHADRGRSILDPFRDHLEMRWAAGYRNGTGLWREIHERGFTGQSGIVRQWATRRRRQAADQAPPAKPPKAQPPTPRKAARLLMSEPDKLSGDDRRFVTTLLELSPPIARAVELSKAFSTMIKQSLADQLDGWISAAENGGFKGFAGSLRQDRDAVHAAALEHRSSRGTNQPAEGHQAVHVRPRRIRPSAPQSTCRRVGENQAANFFQKLCTQKNEEPIPHC
jgi:transposase